MKQAVAGVAPATVEEVTVMTVWPSIAATRYGQWWGRRYRNRLGIRLFGIPITVGYLIAILSIPFILPVYFHMLIPRLPLIVFGKANRSCRRYRLTNRRVIIEPGLGGAAFGSVAVDGFDEIRTEVLPGQEWFRAGSLVFLAGGTEVFRLAGVPNPEPFRQTCLKSRASYVGIQTARGQGLAV